MKYLIVRVIIPMTMFIVLSSWPQGHCESTRVVKNYPGTRGWRQWLVNCIFLTKQIFCVLYYDSCVVYKIQNTKYNMYLFIVNTYFKYRSLIYCTALDWERKGRGGKAELGWKDRKQWVVARGKDSGFCLHLMVWNLYETLEWNLTDTPWCST